ncbi:hypothetical protein CROQUDRAFT_89968 [Cronartium quercuum f. sp. fusiforme G11]|uniref:Uncharacterized protein n=1 Tax=Cronartium quercuum f. sp. fusiforme G11 TaxID=708437 RepID=A0A9P6NSD8_9BASI|nr:hypothetical protein CROQUDRAFT_89968 [Cronartium quercuum f. sp. fusiforme G11]
MVCKDHLALSSRPSNSQSTDPSERPSTKTVDRPTMHCRSIDGANGPIRKTGLATVFADHR